jgi:hypothetical protein
MERVDGMALRNLCGKANPAAEVARLGTQIAEALAAAAWCIATSSRKT